MAARNGQCSNADPTVGHRTKESFGAGKQRRTGSHHVIDQQHVPSGQRSGPRDRKQVAYVLPAPGRRTGRLARVVAQATDRPILHRHSHPGSDPLGDIGSLIVPPGQQPPGMKRHGNDAVHASVQSAVGKVAAIPGTQVAGRAPAVVILETMNGPLPGTARNELEKSRGLHDGKLVAQPLGQRIVRTAPESGLGCQRTAHHTESTLALVQLAAAYGTDRRQKKPLYIIEDRHRRES